MASVQVPKKYGPFQSKSCQSQPCREAPRWRTVFDNEVDLNSIGIHGSLSASAAYSPDYNYYGDTQETLDLNSIDVILNATLPPAFYSRALRPLFASADGASIYGTISAGKVGSFLLASVSAQAADYAIIAHPGASQVSLGKDQLKNILLGSVIKWDDGTIIKLAVLNQGPLHTTLLKEVVSRSPDQFEKHWKKQVFTGKGVMPASFPSEEELAAYVAKTPGALGYISASANAQGAKVLQVE